MARTVSKVSLTFLAIILITLIVFWQSKVADQDLTNLDAFDDIKGPLTSSSAAFSKAQVYAKPLNNDTIRAILGSSTWTLLHTMAARFPPEPTIEMQLEYAQFLNLLAKMYPCGQCARHFQGLLKQYPPKLASQPVFAEYVCFLHNQVNKRLSKPQFDCKRLDERWDCGCGIEMQ